MRQLMWTKTRSAEVVGVTYMCREIRKRLGSNPFMERMPEETRVEVLEHICSEDWLRWRNGQTVGSVVRDARVAVFDHFLSSRGS